MVPNSGYADMFKESNQGKLDLTGMSIESLILEATTHLNSSDYCIEEGVYKKVPAPAPLSITDAPSTSTGRSCKTGDDATNNKDKGSPTGPSDKLTPQELVKLLLEHANSSDDVAKLMFHTFKCPFHLIPREKSLQVESNNHFIDRCPLLNNCILPSSTTVSKVRLPTSCYLFFQ